MDRAYAIQLNKNDFFKITLNVHGNKIFAVDTKQYWFEDYLSGLKHRSVVPWHFLQKRSRVQW